MSALKVAVVPVTPFQQNCTLLWDEASRAAVVVDPGGEPERIMRTVEKLRLAVEAIWLTHGHLDHAGGAAALREAIGGAAPVALLGPDARDEMLLQGLAVQGQLFGIQGLAPLVPDRYLREGETLSVASHRFEVLHCPGHTPGHVVFVNRAARFAQLGDVLFQGSVGRTDFPYSDGAALLASIRTKLLPLPDDMAFVCGHGAASTIGAERRSNPFLQ